MYTSLLTVASLCALALANVDRYRDAPIRRQTTSVNSAAQASALSSLLSIESLILPPASIASELTGVPPEVTAALFNPSLISALESQFLSSLPAWYTSLPAAAQTYIINAGGLAASYYPEITSLEAIAGTTLGASSASSNTSVSATSSVQNTTITTSKATSSSSTVSTVTTATTSSSAAVSSSTSKAGAAPTGAIVGSVLSAVGILGLAIAL